METNPNKHYKKQSKQIKKTIIIGIFSLILLGFISFWWMNYKDSATIIVNQTLLKPFELGTTISLSKDDFIKEIRISKDLKGLTEDRVRDDLELSEIPKGDKVGTFQILLKHKETIDYDIMFKGDTSFEVKIVDSIAPEVNVKKSITLNYGESLVLKDIERVLEIKDMSNTEVKANLKTFKSNKTGMQKISVIVSDIYKNETKINVEVKVKEKPKLNTPKNNQNTQFIKKGGNSSYTSGPWIVDGNVPISKVNEINNEWNKIPSHLRNLVINNGWKLYITSYQIAGRYYNGSIKGSIAAVTRHYDKKVYVNYKGRRIRRATIHEIGHVLDREKGYLSNSSEFKSIYKDERYKMKEHEKVDNHNISDASEYFAQCFLEYCKYPTSLKKSAPRTYNYFSNHVMN